MNQLEQPGAPAPHGSPQRPGGYPTPTAAPNGPPAGALAAARPPVAMASARRWLRWRYGPADTLTGRRPKVPWYSNGGRRHGPLDCPEDSARLVTYDEAWADLCRSRDCFDGLGFALGFDGAGGYWQGGDFDDVPHNRLSDLANAAPSYVELSPSGMGCHAIGYGRHFHTLAPNKSGIEAYAGSRFFTFTGNVIRPGPLCCIADFVEQALVIRHGGCGADAEPAERMPDEPQTESDDKVMRSFWNASNAARYRALWFGDLSAYNGDHSKGDFALVQQLAFYTLNNQQLVRLFHASALGQRDKAYRQDYIDRTVAGARALHAPRLARSAAIAAAMGGAR
ncbi:MAG: hypothetical protein ABL916_07560 [Burkholderiaceae bacterium]